MSCSATASGNIGTIAAFFMSDDTIFGGIGTLQSGQTFPTASDFVATVTIGGAHSVTEYLRCELRLPIP